MRLFLSSIFIIFSIATFSQVVEETILLDKDSLTYQVIYQPTLTRNIFSKKIAVFANDTSVKALGKNYTHGYLNGIYKAYYPSGKTMLFANYANSKLFGDWTWYDENGDVITKGEYKKGVKHGFWAYRSVKLYGRYKNGLKNRTWTQYDLSGLKQKSFYRKGKLIRGKGVDDVHTSPIIENNQVTKNIDIKEVKDSLLPDLKKVKLSREYEQAISFLTSNILFRKELKAHFGRTFKEKQQLKKNYRNGQFFYALSSDIINMKINSFVKEQMEGKIQVVVIDSVLKNKKEDLAYVFDGKYKRKNQQLYESSTKKSSPITIYFSEISNNFMRIDAIRYGKTINPNAFTESYRLTDENQKFRVLLYFDNQGTLKGAEYQK